MMLASCMSGICSPRVDAESPVIPSVAGSVALSPLPASRLPETVLSSVSAVVEALPNRNSLGDRSSLGDIVGIASAMRGTDFRESDVAKMTRSLRATSGCVVGFVASPDLKASAPVPMPAKGGIFFSDKELHTWRTRIVRGPFIVADDYVKGSPGDWSRVKGNARAFLERGESMLPEGASFDMRARHGGYARDAAFYYLLTQDVAALSAVREYLISQAQNPVNDFASLCIRPLVGSPRDAYFAENTWFLRFLVTYDFVRQSLSSAERVTIENYIRRSSYFFAAHSDWGLEQIFPKRLSGDYSVRARDAASVGNSIWASRRIDSNGDCRIDEEDNPAEFPLYSYTRADGSNGPRLAVLVRWFNNRRSVNALSFGVAGLILADSELITRSKRYFMEWLSFGVYPDGSEGEFERNGDYCIPNQGIFYAAQNIQGAMILARALARQGDNSMAAFSTTDGLFGTESGIGGKPKSLELVAATLVALKLGKLPWYAREAQKSIQEPRASTYMGEMSSYYMGSGRAADNYHELGLIVAASVTPNVPVVGLVLRDPKTTALRFPGSTGNPVTTGWGSWSDAFGALPAALLIRDCESTSASPNLC